jgi:hypothetical protein
LVFGRLKRAELGVSFEVAIGDVVVVLVVVLAAIGEVVRRALSGDK